MGRDKKGCKMDVDERWQHKPSTNWKSAVWLMLASMSTEKSAVVDVDGIFHDPLYGKKCSQINLVIIKFCQKYLKNLKFWNTKKFHYFQIHCRLRKVQFGWGSTAGSPFHHALIMSVILCCSTQLLYNPEMIFKIFFSSYFLFQKIGYYQLWNKFTFIKWCSINVDGIKWTSLFYLSSMF